MKKAKERDTSMTGSFMPYGFTCNHLELDVNDRVTLLTAG